MILSSKNAEEHLGTHERQRNSFIRLRTAVGSSSSISASDDRFSYKSFANSGFLVSSSTTTTNESAFRAMTGLRAKLAISTNQYTQCCFIRSSRDRFDVIGGALQGNHPVTSAVACIDAERPTFVPKHRVDVMTSCMTSLITESDRTESRPSFFFRHHQRNETEREKNQTRKLRFASL